MPPSHSDSCRATNHPVNFSPVLMSADPPHGPGSRPRSRPPRFPGLARTRVPASLRRAVYHAEPSGKRITSTQRFVTPRIWLRPFVTWSRIRQKRNWCSILVNGLGAAPVGATSMIGWRGSATPQAAYSLRPERGLQSAGVLLSEGGLGFLRGHLCGPDVPAG